MFFLEARPPAHQSVLLLLHGAGGSHRAWPAELGNLPDYRVLAIDLPGHGKSDGPGRRLISHYSSSVLAFLSALNIDDVVLMGHSMGGAIALELASIAPNMVRGIIGIGVAARMPVGPALLEGWIEDADQAVTFINNYGFSTQRHDHRKLIRQQFKAAGSMTAFGDFLACHYFDFRRRSESVRAPLLIISGSADRLIPPKYAEAMASSLPNGRYIGLEDAGHYAMLEKPLEVASLVSSFLDELEKRV